MMEMAELLSEYVDNATSYEEFLELTEHETEKIHNEYYDRYLGKWSLYPPERMVVLCYRCETHLC